MRLFTILVCSLLLNAATVSAQSELVAQVKSELVARGVPLTGNCGAFFITNEVAKRTGLKLLAKTGGNRAVVLPDGTCISGSGSGLPGYADGYLIYDTGVGVDMIGDAGTANRPVWQYEHTEVERNLRNAKPAIPNLVMGAPSPGTPQVPTPGPIFSDAALAMQVQRMEGRQMEIHNEVLQIKALVTDTNTKVTEAHGWARDFFVGFSKYVLPALAAAATTWQVTKD